MRKWDPTGCGRIKKGKQSLVGTGLTADIGEQFLSSGARIQEYRGPRPSDSDRMQYKGRGYFDWGSESYLCRKIYLATVCTMDWLWRDWRRVSHLCTFTHEMRRNKVVAASELTLWSPWSHVTLLLPASGLICWPWLCSSHMVLPHFLEGANPFPASGPSHAVPSIGALFPPA